MINKLLIIVGPTAVGKTLLSIELAKKFNGEIISGDSVQVYRGFDIGSAKITEAERENIPHYLIDIKHGNEQYTVGDFKQQAEQLIEQIATKEKLPMIVGGTGLYIQSIINDYQFGESIPKEYLEQVEKIVQQNGAQYLHTLLSQVDIESANKIHYHNEVRLVRAYAYYLYFNKKISDNIQATTTHKYDMLILGLNSSRELIYQRINQRVDMMFEAGLIHEVETLLAQGVSSDAHAMTAIGYKEVVCYLQGQLTLEQCRDLIQRNTRRFAKRQLTWFRNKMTIHWLETSNGQAALLTEATKVVKEWLER